MLPQDNVSSLENHKNCDVTEETFSENNSILLKDNVIEGLITDSVGGGYVKDRQNLYSQGDVLGYSLLIDENSDDDIKNSNNTNKDELFTKNYHQTKSSEGSNYDFKSENVYHNGHVKYRSCMDGDDDDTSDNSFNSTEICGSAPVGNGKWSTLKRKKFNIETNFLREEFENEVVDDSQVGTAIMHHNLNENFLNAIPISPISPHTSLLTAAFSLELQNGSTTQATKVIPHSNGENMSKNNLTSPSEKNFANNKTASSPITAKVVCNKVNDVDTVLDNNQRIHDPPELSGNAKESKHSNNLQNLFMDINTKPDCKGESSKTEDIDKNDKRETLLSGNFSLAMKKSWNNEFIESEKILEQYKNEIPRWYVTFAEIQLVKHLMTGQNVDKEVPELMNSLSEAEKLSNKVHENKDEFEKTFTTFRTDIWKKDIKPNSTPAEDEAEFTSLRANYRWDCELSLADILLFMSVLQVVGGNEIKGAYNLRRAWKIYSKVRDEIDKIKNNANKNDKSEPSSVCSGRWSFGGNLIGRRGSTASMVSFYGSNKGHKRESSTGINDSVSSIEVDPDIEDCLEFSIGVFYFIVSNVPGSFLSMLKAFGFNADREKAICMLENCYSRNGIRAPFAALFLLVNYLFITRGLTDATPSLTRAGDIVKECTEKYPYGSTFLFMACYQARKTENMQGAINYITIGIKSCENAGITSTIHRFEMGITHLIDHDFSTAKDIFELLFYGNTIVFTSEKRSIRLHESLKGSGHFKSRDSTKKGPLSHFFEFELRPFCGLCLAGCYLLVNPKEFSNKEALDVLKQIQAMTNHSIENNSIMASIGFAGFGPGTSKDKKESKNRYNQFAGRHSSKDVKKNSVSPFILFVVLYFRRDIVYMPLKLKEKWANLLETIWEKVQKPTDVDTHAVYLLIRGVFEKFLNTPITAQTTLCECLSLEAGVVNETWVIPHCRYELGELFYKRLDNREAAMEQFKWILKGPRPISNSGGRIVRRDNIRAASKFPSDYQNSSTYNNPDKFKKYEFSRSLKRRCSAATEQITTPQSPLPSSVLSIHHNRKKSGSNSSLLKEVQEQVIKRRLSTREINNNNSNVNRNNKDNEDTFVEEEYQLGSNDLTQNNIENSDDKVVKDKKITGFKFW